MAHILVVDDEPEIVRLVAHLLEGRGHRVSVGHDGQEALDLVAADRPDVLVIDLQLPKIGGLEVVQRLKRAPETKDLPVVMMTAAYPTHEDADRGLSVGADEYVVKPFLRQVLLHNVERLLPGRVDEG